MKILFYRYGSIFEPDVTDAFKALNLEVEEINLEVFEKNADLLTKVNVVKDAIIKNMENGTPYLFVFSINFFPEISAICEKLNTKYVSWTVDCPVLELFSKELQNDNNRLFLFDKKQYQRFHKYNENGIFHLPLASNVSRMDKVICGITNEDRKKYSNDITFVGSLYSEKNDFRKLSGLSEYTRGYLDGLIEAQIPVYGVNFIEESLPDGVVEDMKKTAIDTSGKDFVESIDKFMAAHRYIGYEIAYRERVRTLNELAKYFQVDLYTLSDTSVLKGVRCRGQAKTLDEMPKIFNLSKINLNMTMRPIQTGLPLRIYDIMSAGGFCMTNFQEEILDMFEIGVDIEAYSSIDELIDKCNYYLSHEDERIKIAENGYKKVKDVHNISNRILNMIRMISDKK